MKFDTSYIPSLPNEITIDEEQIKYWENFFKYYSYKRKCMIMWVDFETGELRVTEEKIRELNAMFKSYTKFGHTFKIWSNIKIKKGRRTLNQFPEYDEEKIKEIIKDTFRMNYENNKRIYEESETKSLDWVKENIRYITDLSGESMSNGDLKFNDLLYYKEYQIFKSKHLRTFLILIGNKWWHAAPKDEKYEEFFKTHDFTEQEKSEIKELTTKIINKEKELDKMWEEIVEENEREVIKNDKFSCKPL